MCMQAVCEQAAPSSFILEPGCPAASSACPELVNTPPNQAAQGATWFIVLCAPTQAT